MKKNAQQNGANRLEEAMALLINNQAAFLAQLSETERETSKRFRQIETDMATVLRVLSEHGRVLSEHGRLLQGLPETVREKLASKPSNRLNAAT